MCRRDWLRQAAGAIALCGTGFAGFARCQAGKEPSRKQQVWIYKDIPPEGKETRSPSERHFVPEMYMPDGNDIRVNDSFPCSRLDEDAKGTCVAMTFTLPAARTWRAVAWVPTGGKPGTRPAYDVARELVVGAGRPVSLKLRARTVSKGKARISFECAGMSIGEVEDGITRTQTTDPKVLSLSDTWREVSIDLTKHAEGLSSVLCPLKVTARADDNPGQDTVVVYIDDVRFEIGAAKPAKDE